jgi:hypothetical protein
MNAKALAAMLRNSTALNLDYAVPIVVFEQFDFGQQIAFFDSVDILLSPHRAQLTGINFLEIFPKRYAINFFASLAAASGVVHCSLYLSNGDPEQETKVNSASGYLNRYKVGSGWLCPNVTVAVKAAEEIATIWRKCRADSGNHLPSVQTKSGTT